MKRRPAPAKPPRIDWPELLRLAREVREHAYAPYSKFKVGAAVLGASGRVYVGCNVENSSYGLTICAERNAIGNAVANGEERIVACAIAAGKRPCPPCGMCRQVLAEFGGPDMPVAMTGGRERVVHTVAELLPHAFDPTFL
jgi:cytidine deaminase